MIIVHILEEIGKQKKEKDNFGAVLAIEKQENQNLNVAILNYCMKKNLQKLLNQ